MSPSSTATSVDVALVVDGLEVAYGRRPSVFSGVNIEFRPGVCGLLGPNGAGKTTLLKALAGLHKPREGSIALTTGGVPRPVRECRDRLGFLPQDLGYFPRFTAREFVEYAAWLKRVPSRRRADTVAVALSRTRLEQWADQPIKSLSVGTRQRVAVAAAIVNDPALLLLDEPTSGLDIEERAAFRALLPQLAESSVVIISSHIVEDLVGVCDRVLMLVGGSIGRDVDPEALRSAAALETAYLARARAAQ